MLDQTLDLYQFFNRPPFHSSVYLPFKIALSSLSKYLSWSRLNLLQIAPRFKLAIARFYTPRERGRTHLEL